MPARSDDPFGRRHALDRLIEVAVERVAAVGRDHHIERGGHPLHRCGLDERAGGVVRHVEGPGEHRGDLAVAR